MPATLFIDPHRGVFRSFPTDPERDTSPGKPRRYRPVSLFNQYLVTLQQVYYRVFRKYQTRGEKIEFRRHLPVIISLAGGRRYRHHRSPVPYLECTLVSVYQVIYYIPVLPVVNVFHARHELSPVPWHGPRRSLFPVTGENHRVTLVEHAFPLAIHRDIHVRLPRVRHANHANHAVLHRGGTTDGVQGHGKIPLARRLREHQGFATLVRLHERG